MSNMLTSYPEISPTDDSSKDSAASDRLFVDRCLQGEAQAWDELYHRYHKGLVTSIEIMLGRRNWDPNLIDEIAARVWYELVANNARLLSRFDATRGCRLTTYLATIAKSESSKFFRTERRRRNREQVVSRAETRSSNSCKEVTPAELQEFLRDLSPREKEFLGAFLLAPTDCHETTYSDTNRWKLTSRIQRKLREFLTA